VFAPDVDGAFGEGLADAAGDDAGTFTTVASDAIEGDGVDEAGVGTPFEAEAEAERFGEAVAETIAFADEDAPAAANVSGWDEDSGGGTVPGSAGVAIVDPSGGDDAGPVEDAAVVEWVAVETGDDGGFRPDQAAAYAPPLPAGDAGDGVPLAETDVEFGAEPGTEPDSDTVHLQPGVSPDDDDDHRREADYGAAQPGNEAGIGSGDDRPGDDRRDEGLGPQIVAGNDDGEVAHSVRHFLDQNLNHLSAKVFAIVVGTCEGVGFVYKQNPTSGALNGIFYFESPIMGMGDLGIRR